MTVDVVVLFFFGILVYLGWRSGAVSQVIRIVAALAVVFGAPPASVLVREVLFAETELTAPIVEVGSLFIAGLGIYLAIAVGGWLAVRTMRAASKTLSTVDRFAGCAIGAVKGALIVYFLLAGAVLLQVPMERIDPDDDLHMRDGRATSFVEDYNILAPWQFPELAQLHDALRVGALTRMYDGHAEIREEGRAADFLRREDVQGLLDDEPLMRAVMSGNYARTLAHDDVRALLTDDEFVDALEAVDWETILNRAEVGSTEKE